MKLNHFVAMAALALLVIGAMANVTAGTSAQTTDQPATAQDQVCAGQDNDADGAANGPDTDTQDVQCGAQDENGADDEAEAVDSAEVNDAADAEDAASTEDAAGDNEQDAATLGTPTITAEQAQATAEKHLNAGTASQVELDDEKGQLVYSVEIGGTDVKIDALTGTVLGVEGAED